MKIGIIESVLFVLLVSNANGLFDKDKAKNDPVARLVISALGPNCEKMYDKVMDKADHVWQPMWNWLIGTCEKACGKSAEMQEALPYLHYILNFVDRLFEFFKKSSVKLDVWGLCPKLVNKKVYIEYIEKIQIECLEKKPHGYNVMHAKDLCHLTATESFKETAKCIKNMIVEDVKKKVIPPPFDCIGNVKKYCAPQHHPVVMGWMDFFMVVLLKARNAPKTMKDKSGNSLEAKWNIFGTGLKWFDNKCKADKGFTSHYNMITA